MRCKAGASRRNASYTAYMKDWLATLSTKQRLVVYGVLSALALAMLVVPMGDPSTYGRVKLVTYAPIFMPYHGVIDTHRLVMEAFAIFALGGIAFVAVSPRV